MCKQINLMSYQHINKRNVTNNLDPNVDPDISLMLLRCDISKPDRRTLNGIKIFHIIIFETAKYKVVKICAIVSKIN